MEPANTREESVEKSSTLVRAVNHLDRDLGEITDDQRQQVTKVLGVFMEDLRAVQKKWSRLFYREFPEQKPPCQTCAFSPRQDDRTGFAPTAYGLLRSIRREKPFFCHVNQPHQAENLYDPKTLSPCMGWIVVGAFDESRLAAESAFQEIKRIVPGVGDVT